MNSKLTLALMMVGLLALPAWGAAPLLPGTSNKNPNEGLAAPFYTDGLPAHVIPANLVTTHTCDYSLPGDDFAGRVTSWAYADPADLAAPGSLTFVYHYTNTTPAGAGTRDMVRATVGDVSFPWKGWLITDSGSDNSGSSTIGGGAIDWTDGDPNFILRDPTVSGEGITFQWRAVSDGTVLRNPSDDSALMWLDTNALSWQITNTDIIDSGLSAECTALAPAQFIIPEPTTAIVWSLLAALGLGMAARRRRSR